MKIECLCRFLEGREVFEKGDQRTVSDTDGQRFVDNGWAKDLSKSDVEPTPTASGEVTLDVHSARHVVGDSNG